MSMPILEHVFNLYQHATVETRLAYVAASMPAEPWLLSAIGSFFRERFEEQGGLVDIGTAVAIQERAVELVPEGHGDKPAHLNNLVITFLTRFERLGNLEDIDNAIRVQLQAVELIPDDHADKPGDLNYLGSSFLTRFDFSGDLADLDSAIRVQQQAVDLTPDGHPDKPGDLTNLGNTFLVRFHRSGELGDVDSAIRIQHQAASLTPVGHADKPGILNDLGNSFLTRFQRSGDMADVTNAIKMQGQAVDLTSEGHVHKPAFLSNMGASFMRRYERLGDVVDVSNAIHAQQQAADLTSDGNPDKPARLNNLAASYKTRFDRLGDLTDIDNAIRVQQQAVDFTPEDHSDKPGRLSNLGNSFLARFQRIGDLTDVDTAIRMQREAVDLTAEGDPNKPGRMYNLGTSLIRRFERLKDLPDVDAAIRMQRQAVDLTPDGHANTPGYLNNLGHSFLMRFEWSEDPLDIDDAIRVQRQAVDLTPKGHVDKPGRLSNLGVSLLARSKRAADLEDVDDAIRVQQQAIDLSPEGHASKHVFSNNIGNSFLRRFERSGNPSDIDSTIRVQREAVDLIPDGHSDKVMYLNNLGSSFQVRFERVGELADFHTAVDLFKRAANDVSGPPSTRFSAARRWAGLLSSKHSTSSPLDAHEMVVELIPRLIWLGSKLHRRYEVLPAIAEAVSAAAAAAIAAGDLACALEWLEEGRCVIWGQMLQLRTPLDDIRAVDAKLATDLERVSRELDSAGTNQGLDRLEPGTVEDRSLEDEAQRHRRLAEEYERMIEKARGLPGCGGFLRPKRLAQFRSVADSGPVVIINVDATRCDALILRASSDAVLHIPLPTLKRGDVARWKDLMLKSLQRSGVRDRGSRRRPAAGEANTMSSVLANLWLGIVRPVLLELKLLGNRSGDIPHITWCTTGPLGFLPLHAAGLYDRPGGPKVYDLVVSSYTPTLSALLEAKRHVGRASPTPSILAVSQPGTPGQSSLPGTIAEIAAIKERVGNLGLYLDREEATKESVLKAMAEHSWIHLACHAHQHTEDPTKSAFILHNSRLELIDIMKKSFTHTELAVLSACQTATGDEMLLEEAVHLAAGMLMAGYRSVVATMWSIKDKDAPVVAEEFYLQLMKEGGGRKVAYALHDAVKRLRNEVGEQAFDRWVPFIHIGM
ncbi:TPR-like protein [Amylostereum chailletii]|nr:TPR-like protein [Amylostereum chailletii]